MTYSIGEVAKMTGITVSTLRYYDKEGLFPEMERTNGGIREFTDKEISALRIIECLKMTDMPIKDIRQFMDWCHQGDCTLEQRQAMFHERLEIMNQKMAELQKTINTIKYKCWYYDTAAAAGSEEVVKTIMAAEMPADIRKYQQEMNA